MSHNTINNLYTMECTVHVVQTTSGVAIGETKDRSKEFVYDHSYWSVNPQDTHYISQEQVIVNTTGECTVGGKFPGYKISRLLTKSLLTCL